MSDKRNTQIKVRNNSRKEFSRVTTTLDARIITLEAQVLELTERVKTLEAKVKRVKKEDPSE